MWQLNRKKKISLSLTSKYLDTTVKRLIAVTVVAFVLSEALFAGQRSGFELYSARNEEFRWWQLFSYMFTHGGWQHLGFNMLALFFFGPALEARWGGRKFLYFYLICGIGAGLTQLLVLNIEFNYLYSKIVELGVAEQQLDLLISTGLRAGDAFAKIDHSLLQEIYMIDRIPTVGASGAIYGVLVAFAFNFPNAKLALLFLPVPIAAKYFVPVLLLFDLSAGITGFSIFGSNVAHFAHIGGAVVGFILLYVWIKPKR